VTQSPPTVRANRGNTFQRLAQTSWLAPLIAIALGLIVFFIHGNKPGPASKVQAVVSPALILLGLASGLIALIGVAKVGRRGVLVPAAIGTILNLVMIGGVVMPWIFTAKPTVLQPAVHANGHRVLKDDSLGLTLDIPNGFAEFPEGKQLQRANYVFVKGDTTDRNLDLLFSVTAMPGPLPKRRLQTNEIAAKANTILRTFNWRGMQVDGLVVSENLLGTPFTTFNIQLPLLPRALQISVAGPAARQAELEQIAAALLPSIDGQSNW